MFILVTKQFLLTFYAKICNFKFTFTNKVMIQTTLVFYLLSLRYDNLCVLNEIDYELVDGIHHFY